MSWIGKTKKRRTVLWEAQNRRCFYCRRAVDAADVTVDHVRSIHRKGSTAWENIVAACGPCNRLKGAHEPDWLLQRLGVNIPFVAYREMTLAPIYVQRAGVTVNVGGNRGLAAAQATAKDVVPEQKLKRRALIEKKVRELVRQRQAETEQQETEKQS